MILVTRVSCRACCTDQLLMNFRRQHLLFHHGFHSCPPSRVQLFEAACWATPKVASPGHSCGCQPVFGSQTSAWFGCASHSFKIMFTYIYICLLKKESVVLFIPLYQKGAECSRRVFSPSGSDNPFLMFSAGYCNMLSLLSPFSTDSAICRNSLPKCWLCKGSR